MTYTSDEIATGAWAMEVERTRYAIVRTNDGTFRVELRTTGYGQEFNSYEDGIAFIAKTAFFAGLATMPDHGAELLDQLGQNVRALLEAAALLEKEGMTIDAVRLRARVDCTEWAIEDAKARARTGEGNA